MRTGHSTRTSGFRYSSRKRPLGEPPRTDAFENHQLSLQGYAGGRIASGLIAHMVNGQVTERLSACRVVLASGGGEVSAAEVLGSDHSQVRAADVQWRISPGCRYTCRLCTVLVGCVPGRLRGHST